MQPHFFLLLAELVDVFHGLGILFEGVSKLLRLDGNGSSHEFRDVVAPQQLAVVVRMAHGSSKGLLPCPFLSIWAMKGRV